MKKDKKFLLELEKKLNSISKKKRDAIVLKYRKIIDEKINEKKKIKDILKEIGTPEEIAQKEIIEIKKDKKIDISGLKENVKKIGDKTKSGIKKVYNGITKDIQIKPQDNSKKNNNKKLKEKIDENELKQIKIKSTKITKKELNKKLDEEDKLIKERIKKSLKDNNEKILNEETYIKEERNNKNKIHKKIEEKLNDEIIEEVITENVEQENIIEQIEEISNQEELIKNKEKKFVDLKDKFIKKKNTKIINDVKESEEELIENKENKFTKLKEKFKNRKDKNIVRDIIDNNINEEEIIVEKDKPQQLNNNKKKKTQKQKEIKISNEDESIFDIESNKQIEEICEITEIISDKPKYISKKERTKKMIFQLLGILVIAIMLFVWMWIGILLLATLFAFLDGIKLYGISIAFLGLDILFFWLTIMMNRWIFKKKNVYKTNLIIIISSVAVIAVGIALFIYQTSKIEHESDVALKYSMTTKYDTYKLPSKEEEKMYIFFNSNYNTQYMVKYDNNLDGKFKLEVKYYENYYDYNIKKSTNNLYVSLSVDPRDRISSYIDDFKENKIYNKNELARYTVKITVSEKDFERLVIEN